MKDRQFSHTWHINHFFSKFSTQDLLVLSTLFLQFCLRSLYIGLKWASLTFAKGKYSCAPIRIQQHLTQDQRTVMGSLLILSMNSD